MGLLITADGIAMLQKFKCNESPVTINDLVNADGNAGTEVMLKNTSSEKIFPDIILNQCKHVWPVATLCCDSQH